MPKLARLVIQVCLKDVSIDINKMPQACTVSSECNSFLHIMLIRLTDLEHYVKSMQP